MSKNKIEKSTLKAGGFKPVRFGNSDKEVNIKSVLKKNDGSVILTLSPLQQYVNEALEEFGDLPKTENAEFEIIELKQLTNNTNKTDTENGK